jgi:hypothetical protein
MISRIGTRGGNMTKEVHGIEYYREIGKRRKEGNPSIKKQDELKEADQQRALLTKKLRL